MAHFKDTILDHKLEPCQRNASRNCPIFFIQSSGRQDINRLEFGSA